MSNLATKYRPHAFKDIVRQDNAVKVLTNQITTGEVRQGYLFTGGAGTGKTTTARIFANEINNSKGDYIEIDGASNNGVENVRNIIEDCKLKSLTAKYKIYIIDEVHMLSTGAFNALLKVLEEPPAGVIFILCTTDPQKIPGTILSRLQRFDFKRIPTKDIVKRLEYIISEENNITYDKDALTYIAKIANGGMRDSIMKLDTVLSYSRNITVDNVLSVLGISSYSLMNELIIAMYNKDIPGIIEVLDNMYYDGKDLKVFIKDTRQYLLDLIKLQKTKDTSIISIPGEYIQQANKIINRLNTNGILYYLDIFNDLNYKIKFEQDILAIIESELILECQQQ